VDNMIVQILTTSANDYAFEDWGEENLLRAIETNTPYIDDPPVSESPFDAFPVPPIFCDMTLR
jgi:hypothetical protein